MTNSYSSSKKALRLVFIHGLNNNPECFLPIMDHFRALGYETELVVLPGHGEVREETSSHKTAFSHFTSRMKLISTAPYAVIAFSQGALYLQLWLEKNPDNKPVSQVLLAPALYLRRQKFLDKVLLKLPAWLTIKSFSPKPFRRYHTMKIWEYRTLFDGVKTYQKTKGKFRIPTKVFIDPMDELVDSQTLEECLAASNLGHGVELVRRPTLKRGPGQHHIIFHPDYFRPEEWERFTGLVLDFLLRFEATR
ncbi:MAG TPA: alpha/beta fold hydrolase [Bacteriovoracaceae bacterium]|nr:alpha/beta fold hydrolase [Bacteriovoracaceae bacterium]